jgi:hypothetical protein
MQTTGQTKPEPRSMFCYDMTNDRVCANCGHYYQHYVRSGGNYIITNAGHCATPRLKEHKPLTGACENWVQK